MLISYAPQIADSSRTQKYINLYFGAKCALALFHGFVVPGRVFSLNNPVQTKRCPLFHENKI